MASKKNHNHVQDIERTELRVRLFSLKERFEKFCSNDFQHLCDKVDKIDSKFDWLLGTVILGIFVSILLKLYF